MQQHKTDKVLSSKTLARIYNWIGKKLDSQSFYEQPGLDKMIKHGQFDTAKSIFEFGCGTGRLAEQLLQQHLPDTTNYTAIDISPKMVEITQQRLKHWQPRIDVKTSDGSVKLDYSTNNFDRFVSTYVVDLLSEKNACTLIEEAHRILKTDGLLCLVSITHGEKTFSRLFMKVWQWVNKLHPVLTGGCRPVNLAMFLAENKWHINYHKIISQYGIAVEVVIAQAS